jgi:SAM-dependent methyltransferase
MPLDPAAHAHRAASFGQEADLYAASRPSYPDAVVDHLLPAPGRVLDLAAGTGKMTALLVAHGHDVVAVDHSPAMLARLAEALPGVATHVAAAEALPLADASVDAVVVAQAWHWFDEAAAGAEIARVLRPGGVLGIVWNVWDESVDWVARFAAIVRRGDALGSAKRAPRPGPAFGPPELTSFRWDDVVTAAGLRALAASRSHLLTLPDADRALLLDRVDDLARTHPDLAGRAEIALPYSADCWRFTNGGAA